MRGADHEADERSRGGEVIASGLVGQFVKRRMRFLKTSPMS